MVSFSLASYFVRPFSSVPSMGYETAFERLPDVLEIEQISRVICYAYDTIYKWCASGKLKSIQVCNKRLIPKEWLFEFMLSKEFLFKPMPSDWQIVTVHRALLNYEHSEKR